MTPYHDKPELPPVVGGSLPTWLVAVLAGPLPTPVGERVLLIKCPRADCQQPALVTPNWAQGGYATRPCTYCFRTAKIPPRLRTGRGRKLKRSKP